MFPLWDRLLVAILAQAEQAPIYNAINQDLTILGHENRTVQAIAVGIFACPSDPDSGIPRAGFFHEANPFPTPLSDLASVSFTSYTGMMGSVYTTALPDWGRDCRVDPIQVARTNGCINDLSPLTTASVTDGLDSTILVAERSTTVLRGLNTTSEPRASETAGWWFAGESGHTLMDARFPPNIHRKGSPLNQGSWASTASSQHPAGVNALFGDGSVRFIKETIDSTPLNPQTGYTVSEVPGVWQKLATRNGGEVISADSY